MRLSRTNAEKIVKELNTVIDQSVNMMNEEGIIIASTDQDRVGQIHEGARKIIEQKKRDYSAAGSELGGIYEWSDEIGKKKRVCAETYSA